MTAPSPAAAELCDYLRREAIVEAMDLASSYARSAAEAAWRNDHVTLDVHLRQLRIATITSIKTYKSLSAPPSLQGDT